MGILSRRSLLLLCPLAALAAAAASSLRGTLAVAKAQLSAILTSGGSRVLLNGDADTLSVLADPRLNGADFEVIGQRQSPGEFEVGPFYTHAMFVHQGGKKLLISYWCPTCSIRAYTPGNCVCCQQYTKLDLVESFDR